MSFGDFNDTAEQVLARRYGHRPVPVPADFGAPEVLDYDAPYPGDPEVRRAPRYPLDAPYLDPTWRKSLSDATSRRAPRSWLKPGRTGKAGRAPSKKARLQALKRTVKTSLRLGRCPHALAEWRALVGSQLPGAKKAARQLKKTFANKCMRIPRGGR